ncbi:hypothetical protein CC78DRAFT_532347 [Lojkania enalia]|uniref:Uncharacterized protein n=1 Tax=Lojkania enalia TaxID=147567 RepID=A0A9P4KD88_9PLEO|nr:hypothetical protein CC78DRAFT_532347 [Didymosphaeria enalia]
MCDEEILLQIYVQHVDHLQEITGRQISTMMLFQSHAMAQTPQKKFIKPFNMESPVSGGSSETVDEIAYRQLGLRTDCRVAWRVTIVDCPSRAGNQGERLAVRAGLFWTQTKNAQPLIVISRTGKTQSFEGLRSFICARAKANMTQRANHWIRPS